MKKIFFIFYFLVFSFSFFAQNIDDFFMFLPGSYMSQLNADQRRELLNKRNKKDSAVINNYGGIAKLLAFDPVNNYIKIQTSGQGFFEAKKWILEDSTPLFAMSSWVCSPACDGGIGFFKSDYTPVIFDEKQFPRVKITDFFNRDSLAAKEISESDLKNRFDLFLARFEFQPAGNDILVINDNESYMNKEDYEKWRPLLKGNTLPLIWKNGRFEKGEAYFRE
jgi:hypothetical protein